MLTSLPVMNAKRMASSNPPPPPPHRFLEYLTYSNNDSNNSNNDNNNVEQECLYSYLNCMSTLSDCMTCLESLDAQGIQWTLSTDVADGTCSSALTYLYNVNVCTSLSFSANIEQKNLFCEVYQKCKVYQRAHDYYDSDDDEIEEYDDKEEGDDLVALNCDELTECDWEGISKSMIGNSMCNREACYNTAICNYDGGDCCEDTCTTNMNKNNKYAQNCGVDGYACKDPSSVKCSLTLSKDCPSVTPAKNDEKDQDKNKVSCASNEKHYHLDMYDSWGDGWDDQNLIIHNITTDSSGNSSSELVYSMKLEDGYKETRAICLSDGCYAANIGNSEWAEDISWVILSSATKIASGGAPSDCQFSVGGNYCENTCKESEDDQNKSNNMDKDLETCAKSRCPIQYGQCLGDSMNCAPCIIDDAHLPFCTTSEKFQTLVHCVKCSCLFTKDDKSNDKSNFYEECMSDKSNSDKLKCDSNQSLHGTEALLKYTKCSSIDDDLALFKDWHEDQFGSLDDFEECAHNYAINRVGKALDCLNILAEIVEAGETNNEENPAIFTIAKQLYLDPEGICDCSMEANALCPDCDKFLRFKTLLHETLDACQSVDEVDCNAWEDFSMPCKANVRAKFGSLDFSQPAQCKFIFIFLLRMIICDVLSFCKQTIIGAYVENNCGNVGAFPTFRRLDCDGEISSDAWNFFKYFQEGCKNNGHHNYPVVAPIAVPIHYNPNPKPYVPSGPSPKAPTKPYVPPEDRNKKGNNGNTSNGSRGLMMWSFILLIVGSGFFIYKRRTRSFTHSPYQGYQKAHTSESNASLAGNDLFVGLDINSSSNSYQPVRIP